MVVHLEFCKNALSENEFVCELSKMHIYAIKTWLIILSCAIKPCVNGIHV